MEYLTISIQVITIIGFIYGLISAFNKIKTETAVQDEKIKQHKSDATQLRTEFEKYKDKNDTKFKDVFKKLDEHYQKLDSKIDNIQRLIIDKLK